MKIQAVLAVALVSIVACGGNDGGGTEPADFVGSWKMVKGICNGKELVPTGYTVAVVVAPDGKTATYRVADNKCIATVTEIPVDENGTMQSGRGKVNCDPGACFLDLYFTVDGVQGRQNAVCPTEIATPNMPSPVLGRAGTQLTMTANAGSTTCTQYFDAVVD